MDITTIDGDDLPSSLKDALLDVIRRKGPAMRPAKMSEIRGLLEGTTQARFEVGDIVVLRKHAEDSFKWPEAGEKCIVTQVLDTPHRSGESGSTRIALRNDIALAFVDEDDDQLVEFLHDSRNFIRVGSIYDPMTLPSGETLPVE